MIQSPKPTLAHFQALIDFVCFKKSYTGEKFGNLLHSIHKGVMYNPGFIGSHMVGGAYNSGKYVEVIE